MLALALRDFSRSGVDRPDEVRERVRALHERETELGLQFSRVIRNGRRSLRVDPARLEGLPDDFVAAHPVGEDGLVELTTDYPDYMPVRTLAVDRRLREDLTVAFLTRAWPENEPVLGELLAVRRELAQTLGYDDWPAFDAEVKMVGSGPAIPEFIDMITELAARGRRVATTRRCWPAPGRTTPTWSRSPRSTAPSTASCGAARSATSTPGRCAATSTSTTSAPGCSR